MGAGGHPEPCGPAQAPQASCAFSPCTEPSGGQQGHGWWPSSLHSRPLPTRALSPQMRMADEPVRGVARAGGPRGLSLLVQQVLGKPLDKTQQLSNWDRRPLSEEQLIYAGVPPPPPCPHAPHPMLEAELDLCPPQLPMPTAYWRYTKLCAGSLPASTCWITWPGAQGLGTARDLELGNCPAGRRPRLQLSR